MARICASEGRNIRSELGKSELGKSELGKSELGRNISRRIIARERIALQLQFLEELQKQPFSQFVTLTGESALRGVYLQQIWGDSLTFEAPPVIANRLNTLMDAFGKAVYQEGNRFVFKGRAAVASKTHIYITITAPQTLPLVPDEKLFVPGTGRTVPVRVTPLVSLLDSVFQRLKYNPHPIDMLELWLLHQSHSLTRETQLIKANSHSRQSSFVFNLSVEQIRQLKAGWQMESRDIPFPVPPLVRVYKDLMRLFPRSYHGKDVETA